MRISKEEKRRLQRLQEAWRRARGEAPTQQELVARGLGFLERHWDAFLAEAAWRPWTEDEIKKLEATPVKAGRWSVDEIDDVVYGAGP